MNMLSISPNRFSFTFKTFLHNTNVRFFAETRRKKLRRCKVPDEEYNKLLGATRIHRDLFGHTLMNTNFIIPSRERSIEKIMKEKKDKIITIPYKMLHTLDNWPEELWGFEAGKYSHNMRILIKRNRIKASKIKDLRSIGFCFDIHKYTWDKIIMPSFRTYLSIYGDLNIHEDFIIPYGNDQWPKATWNEELGKRSYQIKRNLFGSIRKYLDELKDLGFSFELDENNIPKEEQVK